MNPELKRLYEAVIGPSRTDYYLDYFERSDARGYSPIPDVARGYQVPAFATVADVYRGYQQPGMDPARGYVAPSSGAARGWNPVFDVYRGFSPAAAMEQGFMPISYSLSPEAERGFPTDIDAGRKGAEEAE